MKGLAVCVNSVTQWSLQHIVTLHFFLFKGTLRSEVRKFHRLGNWSSRSHFPFFINVRSQLLMVMTVIYI